VRRSAGWTWFKLESEVRVLWGPTTPSQVRLPTAFSCLVFLTRGPVRDILIVLEA